MQPRLPANILLALAVQKSRQYKKKIRQAIDVMQNSRIYRLLSEKTRHIAFRAPCNGSRVMQVGGGGTSPRKHKTVERLQFRVEPINLIFEPRDLFLCNAQRGFFRTRPLGPAQICAHVEQIILDVP